MALRSHLEVTPVLIKKMPGEQKGELLNKWLIDNDLLNRIWQYQLLTVLDIQIKSLFWLFPIFSPQEIILGQRGWRDSV